VQKKALSRGSVAAAISAGLLAALAPPARADDWLFTLKGVFNGTPTITDSISGIGAPVLTANEPFTLSARFSASAVVFDTFPGFNAYAPEWINLTVGGQTFTVQTFTQNSTSGLTVALFDNTNTVGVPGHVGAGFLANPPADGAGIVGDWTGSLPDFPVSNLAKAVWPTLNYFGVGFGSGPCPFGPGAGGVCLPKTPGGPTPDNTVVPIPLDGGTFALTLGEYTLNNPSNGVPNNPNANFFSASLTAVPEPSTWALLLVGFAGLACASLRIGRRQPLAATQS